MNRLAAAMLLVAVLVSCGDDAGDDGGGANAEDAAAVSALVDVFRSPDHFGMPDDEATCVAQAFVSGLGAERAAEIDWDNGSTVFTEDEAATAADAFVVCVDLAAELANGIADGYDASDESRACLVEAIDTEQARRSMTSRFADVGRVEVEAELEPDLRMCLTADESTIGERVPS